MGRSRLPERVLFVVGPTAIGKTELAAHLARRFDGEVVGADSRQVYRYMDVGTAKPPAALRAEIRHHLIDVVDPDEPFDVARWRAAALDALAEIEARSKTAIVCGGTGLYLRSLLRGLFSGPAADEELRRRFADEERKRPGTLRDRLRRVDPASAERIHPNDMVRTVRALEVYELTGRPLSHWHAEHGLRERPFQALLIEPTVAREVLHRRIAERSRAMVRAGLLEEVRQLARRGYGRELPAFAAIGYREAWQCLAGELRVEDLAERITVATRRYARRQLVWLRGQMDTVPVAAGDVSAIERLAERFLASH
ncbi:MAG: tRNA (adenosine(37)-N6)-dimethylallyltransferase MiaA [Deltaproteobacteria bacterium]|nr:MAG: tRNA (adenosine(37)-N6)-dimethylallyltransferase MiaA [Deltaproteobacteria bacterium]